GGLLLALMFALDAFVPQQAAVASNGARSIDKTVVRIRSDQKLPERVVYDTSLPTIVPPKPATVVAAAAPPAPAADGTAPGGRRLRLRLRRKDGVVAGQPLLGRIVDVLTRLQLLGDGLRLCGGLGRLLSGGWLLGADHDQRLAADRRSRAAGRGCRGSGCAL